MLSQLISASNLTGDQQGQCAQLYFRSCARPLHTAYLVVALKSLVNKPTISSTLVFTCSYCCAFISAPFVFAGFDPVVGGQCPRLPNCRHQVKFVLIFNRNWAFCFCLCERFFVVWIAHLGIVYLQRRWVCFECKLSCILNKKTHWWFSVHVCV